MMRDWCVRLVTTQLKEEVEIVGIRSERGSRSHEVKTVIKSCTDGMPTLTDLSNICQSYLRAGAPKIILTASRLT